MDVNGALGLRCEPSMQSAASSEIRDQRKGRKRGRKDLKRLPRVSHVSTSSEFLSSPALQQR